MNWILVLKLHLAEVFLDGFLEESCSTSLSSLLLSFRSSSSRLPCRNKKTLLTAAALVSVADPFVSVWSTYVGWSSHVLDWWLLELLEEPRSNGEEKTCDRYVNISVCIRLNMKYVKSTHCVHLETGESPEATKSTIIKLIHTL